MNMGMTGGMVIAVHEAREACKGEADILKRIEKAMRVCRGHWMETNESNQFKSALAAAILESPSEEAARIERSAHALDRFSLALAAAQAGVNVDMASVLGEEIEGLLPLVKMWHEAAQ